jgi:hypothetical protein
MDFLTELVSGNGATEICMKVRISKDFNTVKAFYWVQYKAGNMRESGLMVKWLVGEVASGVTVLHIKETGTRASSKDRVSSPTSMALVMKAFLNKISRGVKARKPSMTEQFIVVILWMACSMARVATGKQMVLSTSVSGTAMKYAEKASRSLNKVELSLVVISSEARSVAKAIRNGDAWVEYQPALKVEQWNKLLSIFTEEIYSILKFKDSVSSNGLMVAIILVILSIRRCMVLESSPGSSPLKIRSVWKSLTTLFTKVKWQPMSSMVKVNSAKLMATFTQVNLKMVYLTARVSIIGLVATWSTKASTETDKCTDTEFFTIKMVSTKVPSLMVLWMEKASWLSTTETSTLVSSKIPRWQDMGVINLRMALKLLDASRMEWSTHMRRNSTKMVEST